MTRFWWVRHGPTHEKAFVGWRDVPADLSDRQAIARLDAHLPKDALLISSDLLRAVTTADALATGRTRLPHNRALREFDFGLWDGMQFDDVAAREPELSRAFWETPGDVTAPGGESWSDVTARASRAVTDLTQRHAERDIVVVAHIGVIMTQIQVASDMTAKEVLEHRIDNLSVTRLDFEAGSWTVGAINHQP